MKTFVYLFSAFLLVGVAVGQSTEVTPTPNPTFDCPSGVDDGTTYPDPNGDCKKYIVCTNGLAWDEECAAGLWYDENTGECNWPDLAFCAASPSPSSTLPGEFTCPSLVPDDQYPDPFDCGKYFSCVGGVSSHRDCPDGLWFDYITKQCDWAETARCSSVSQPPTTAAPPTTSVTSSPVTSTGSS